MRNKIIVMKKIRNSGLFMLSLLLINQDLDAQKVNTFTVQQAAEYAKQNSVQVKNALLDILIQKQTNRDITSIALPQINGNASMTRNIDIPVQTIPDFISYQVYDVLKKEDVRDAGGNQINIPSG